MGWAYRLFFIPRHPPPPFLGRFLIYHPLDVNRTVLSNWLVGPGQRTTRSDFHVRDTQTGTPGMLVIVLNSQEPWTCEHDEQFASS